MQAMEQLRQVKLTSTAVAVEGGEERSDFKLEFAELAEDDPLAPDLRLGICPLPLFRFEESELELIASAPSQDEVRELLEKHGVTTYFFPALVPHVRRGCPPRQLCSSSVCARSIRKRSPMRRRRAISALSHLVVSRRGGLAVGAPVDCTFCAGTTIE
jgi:hypothetical protein